MRLWPLPFLLLGACAATPQVIVPDVSPTSLVGRWGMTTAYSPEHRKLAVSKVLWVELRADGTAQLVSCPAPQFFEDHLVSCRTEPVCLTGSYAIDGSDVSIKVGSLAWTGRYDFIPGGWAWTSSYLGAAATGMLFQEQPGPAVGCSQ